MAQVRLGLAGWGYPEWSGPFYAPSTPPGGRLKAYARVFSFVEADGTYFRTPARDEVARWARETPAGFRVSPKVPAAIAKDKLLGECERETDEFLAALAPLRAEGKLGPVLLQLPPSFRPEKHADRLRAFLAAWPKDLKLAVETRHASWWTDATFDLLREHKAIHVWATTEHGRTPPVVTGEDVFLRFIGDRALDEVPNIRWDRVRRDQTDEIRRWADHLRAVEDTVIHEWIIANNHFTGYAPDAAVKIAEALSLRPPELGLARGGGQRGLSGF